MLMAWPSDQSIMVYDGNHFVAPSLTTFCNWSAYQAFYSPFWIVWVATTSICFLLHSTRTLTHLLPSVLFSSLLPHYDNPSLLINITSWPWILGQSDQSLVLPYTGWVTWLHSQWFLLLKAHQPKPLSYPTKDLAIELITNSYWGDSGSWVEWERPLWTRKASSYVLKWLKWLPWVHWRLQLASMTREPTPPKLRFFHQLIFCPQVGP